MEVPCYSGSLTWVGDATLRPALTSFGKTSSTFATLYPGVNRYLATASVFIITGPSGIAGFKPLRLLWINYLIFFLLSHY